MENKNGTKYLWRDGAEKCSCTGTMLNIGLILETGCGENGNSNLYFGVFIRTMLNVMKYCEAQAS